MPNSRLTRGNTAGQHYVRTITNALKRGFRIDDPDFAHINDIEAWEKIRRDAIIAHALQRRRNAIAGPDWLMVPYSDRPEDKIAAEIMTELMRNIERFREARFNLAESVFRGSSYVRNVGTRRFMTMLDDSEMRSWYVPMKLPHVDRWRFRQVAMFDEHGGFAGTQWQFWSIRREQWELLSIKEQNNFTRNTHENVESSLGYGRGLLNEIYYFWWAISIVWEQYLAGIERWAQGLGIIKLDGVRDASDGKTNDSMADDYLETFEKTKSRHYVVMDKSDEYELVDMPGTGHTAASEALDRLYNGVVQLVLGAVLPTGGGDDVGSNARAQTEAETSDSIFMFDRAVLSESLNCGVVRQVWRLNKLNIRQLLKSMKLPMAKTPLYKITNEKFEDPAANATILASLKGLPIKLKLIEVLEKIGYSPVTDEDKDIIDLETVGQPPAAPGVGGFSADLKNRIDALKDTYQKTYKFGPYKQPVEPNATESPVPTNGT